MGGADESFDRHAAEVDNVLVGKGLIGEGHGRLLRFLLLDPLCRRQAVIAALLELMGSILMSDLTPWARQYELPSIWPTILIDHQADRLSVMVGSPHGSLREFQDAPPFTDNPVAGQDEAQIVVVAAILISRRRVAPMLENTFGITSTGFW